MRGRIIRKKMQKVVPKTGVQIKSNPSVSNSLIVYCLTPVWLRLLLIYSRHNP